MFNVRILLFGLFLTLAESEHAWARQPQESIHPTAPIFVRTDLTGHEINLKRYRGKVVLLNFWATWCEPCRLELPKFGAWHRRYGGDGFAVIAVSMDDTNAPVRRTVRRMRLDFPVLMGDAKLGEAYGGVLGLPVSFLIDRNGRIVAKIRGEADMDALESQVKTLVDR